MFPEPADLPVPFVRALGTHVLGPFALRQVRAHMPVEVRDVGKCSLANVALVTAKTVALVEKRMLLKVAPPRKTFFADAAVERTKSEVNLPYVIFQLTGPANESCDVMLCIECSVLALLDLLDERRLALTALVEQLPVMSHSVVLPQH